MRWPLRYQIMLPMAAAMLLAVIVVGGWGAVLAVREAKGRIETQISQVARILEESNFPLTDAVLRQMKALSGATLVLVDESGRTLAAKGSLSELRIADFPSRGGSSKPESVNPYRFDDRRWLRSGGYFHTTVDLSSRRAISNRETLHILYPEEEYRRAWQRAVVPPIAFVVIALPIVMTLSAVTAARISRRVSRLQSQVGHIAQGDFRQISLTERDDEIRALGQAVNRMAVMLAHYEAEVRRTERMRTLAHLGGGIAHQLRNSATGCRIALDLHEQECATADESETLDVAKRQLQLMEEYIQRFLKLGKGQNARVDEHVDLIELIENILPLVEPAARHAHVELRWAPQIEQANVSGDADRLRQLVINLLLNAIEAAAHGHAENAEPAEVIVELDDEPSGWLILNVIDTGSGPAEEVRAELFEPFVTEKYDGVGLGLSVAREAAHEHGGTIDWERVGERTRFSVSLPCRLVAETTIS